MSWFLLLVGFPLGLAYGTFAEWFVHRFVFHALGKRYKMFSFHWAQHHKAVRQHQGGDPAFAGSFFSWNAHGREVWGVFLCLVLHSPLLAVAPTFYLGAFVQGIQYTRIHRRSHLDPAWCRQSLPWHWDHHMGLNPDANWCVTSEWLDVLLGTRLRMVPAVASEEA